MANNDFRDVARKLFGYDTDRQQQHQKSDFCCGTGTCSGDCGFFLWQEMSDLQKQAVFVKVIELVALFDRGTSIKMLAEFLKVIFFTCWGLEAMTNNGDLILTSNINYLALSEKIILKEFK